MKEKEEPLSEKDWNELFMITDFLHQNFVTRLSSCYPDLKLDDLKLCCLTRYKFTEELRLIERLFQPLKKILREGM